MTTIPKEIVEAFQLPGLHIKELKQEDPEFYVVAKALEQQFTASVKIHTSGVFGPIVKELAEYATHVIGEKHVPFSIGPDVRSLSAVLAVRCNEPQVKKPAILVPHNWLQMVKDDPYMQLGAVVNVASQAVDFYNDRHLIDGNAIIVRRALNYEAEFLRQARNNNGVRALGIGTLSRNPYQSHLMREFRRFESSMRYSRKPVIPKN